MGTAVGTSVGLEVGNDEMLGACDAEIVGLLEMVGATDGASPELELEEEPDPPVELESEDVEFEFDPPVELESEDVEFELDPPTVAGVGESLELLLVLDAEVCRIRLNIFLFPKANR